MRIGWSLAVFVRNSVNDPEVVIAPILLVVCSVNQMRPSRPTAIPFTPEDAVGMLYSVKVVVPFGNSPIRLPDASVNHRLLAESTVSESGAEFAFGSG